MRATGVVRRIDDLGRIVIPKEIRRTMRMKEGDPLEIFTEHSGEIVLKKYSMMAQLSNFSRSYADSLYKVSGLCCAVCDTDSVVAFGGPGRKEALGSPITGEIEEIISSRMSYFKQFPGEKNIYTHHGAQSAVVGVTPIISSGDCAGVVALLAEDGQTLTETQKKLLVLTATLLAGNLES
ncbi:MAG: AbrB/MazE/SpoVT family DNA-binding domain-containing protein [Oscillospiraceae bacterium]|nr:AbrB/MazE/SpoVT family DNA-binding domain-containing protein [Oscillospiraceae bacterium]